MIDFLRIIDSFCSDNNCGYMIIINDTDAKSVKLGIGSRVVKNKLLPLFGDDKKYNVNIQSVRGGTVVTAADKAISELDMSEIDEYVRIADSIRESQYHTKAFKRGLNKTKLNPDEKYSNMLKSLSKRTGKRIEEALEGLATADDAQPQDMFKKFDSALSSLGQKMGLDIRQMLEQRGIKWKLSQDGTAIILWVPNAVTKSPQPIARISFETLTKPAEFEKQLLKMLDLAKGDAPGALENEQERIKTQQQAVREISQSVLNPGQVQANGQQNSI